MRSEPTLQKRPRTTRFSNLSPRPLSKPPPAPDIQPAVTHYVSFDGDAGPDPRLGDVARVGEGLLRIVEVEGPMLVKRSYDIYLRGCGIRKMGGPLRACHEPGPPVRRPDG